MHAISYQLKRCHLSAVAIGRKILRGSKLPEDPDYDGVPDMTPARFDILYLVLGRKIRWLGAPRSIAMAELWRKLGLARATISKAVKRLVQLGLVTCDFHPGGSRRNKVVTLTDEGAARIKRALHLVLTGRMLSRHYGRFVSTDPLGKVLRKRPWKIAEELTNIWDDLQALARHHFDKSEVLYNIRGEPDVTALPPAPFAEHFSLIDAEIDPCSLVPATR
jgi:DNA-binding MarR family transcriptional regulator